MDKKGKKAVASYKLKGAGIGTAYVLVTVTDSTNKLVNRMMTKVTVRSSNPKLILVRDSAGIMSSLDRDDYGNIKLDPNNSVTISMQEGQYDRLFIGISPEQSTDAGAISYSASGGVTVKNGVVYAKKETKKDKPAKVVVKCKKSKPITVYINVVK
jgi:outer membrane scaffolding protein for murein synthesis (MipA/OmpV family)